MREVVFVCPTFAISLRHLPPPSATSVSSSATDNYCQVPVIHSETNKSLQALSLAVILKTLLGVVASLTVLVPHNVRVFCNNNNWRLKEKMTPDIKGIIHTHNFIITYG